MGAFGLNLRWEFSGKAGGLILSESNRDPEQVQANKTDVNRCIMNNVALS